MQQKLGTAMSSPLSAAVANFYMENLERKALQTVSAIVTLSLTVYFLTFRVVMPTFPVKLASTTNNNR